METAGIVTHTEVLSWVYVVMVSGGGLLLLIIGWLLKFSLGKNKELQQLRIERDKEELSEIVKEQRETRGVIDSLAKKVEDFKESLSFMATKDYVDGQDDKLKDKVINKIDKFENTVNLKNDEIKSIIKLQHEKSINELNTAVSEHRSAKTYVRELCIQIAGLLINLAKTKGEKATIEDFFEAVKTEAILKSKKVEPKIISDRMFKEDSE